MGPVTGRTREAAEQALSFIPDLKLSGNADCLPGAVVIRIKEGAGWLKNKFKFVLLFSMLEKQSLCHKVLMRPMITS